MNGGGDSLPLLTETMRRLISNHLISFSNFFVLYKVRRFCNGHPMLNAMKYSIIIKKKSMQVFISSLSAIIFIIS